MTPETPISLPLPEITHNPEYPPTLIDLEFHTPELTQLIVYISGLHKHLFPYLQRIEIVGGMLLDSNNEHAQQSDQSTLYYPTIERSHEIFGDIFGRKKREAIYGLYHSETSRILIYPEATSLMLIASYARFIEKNNLSIPNHQILHLLQADILLHSGQALGHEIAHSFQRGVRVIHAIQPVIPYILFRQLKNYYHHQASKVENTPEVERRAIQSLSIKPLVSDDHLIELLTIARERYRLSQAKR
ncbi:MAG: hypothetical protein A2785_03275 [Candidatus Chisholmbacteria bacterium RIFCSPHIGHO2_01_FULL_49_18]|uniref:Uncharacterized protein n=1 Tax=Candidatus Chisholmbacteria bacterium RIFCSPHIGHO2_01_FULL_49_18 TaxID=1797590 RepID=A0A1G1VMI1_9BACT|nr:MAG: hypothetical protein A2785_03275 [Candidatus Chisholmbacteria bacterium RIFCSPHIGHO2_01_FULL_49_18]